MLRGCIQRVFVSASGAREARSQSPISNNELLGLIEPDPFVGLFPLFLQHLLPAPAAAVGIKPCSLRSGSLCHRISVRKTAAHSLTHTS